MRIATWNLERPLKGGKKNAEIIEILKGLDADIIVLTEANECIDLGDEYKYYKTVTPDSISGKVIYTAGERRVIICVAKKHESKLKVSTYDPQTAICVEAETPFGRLAIYGTIIGIYGNREESFLKNLQSQVTDYTNLSTETSLCIAGDYNLSFGDNYYYTKDGRDIINKTFEEFNIQNLTPTISNNIDHIALSDSFVKGRGIKIETFNMDKILSDHIGVMVEIV